MEQVYRHLSNRQLAAFCWCFLTFNMYGGKNSVLSLYTGWRGHVVSVSLGNSVIRIVECIIVTDVGGSGRGLTSYTTLAFAWRD